MTSEFRRLPYGAMRRQHESLTHTLALLNDSGVETAMRQMQRQQAEIRRLVEGSLAQYTELSRATRQLYDLSLPTAPIRNILQDAHVSWLSELRRVAVPSVHLEGIARLALSDISYDLAVTEHLLPKINYNILANQLSVQMSVMSEVERSMSSLWASYRALAESFVGLEDLVQVPTFVLPEATRTLSVKGYALESLWHGEQPAVNDDTLLEPAIFDESDERIVGLSSLLEEIDVDLVSLYMGAIESFDGTNPDRERHVLTSLRTLWDEVFRVLAPDNAVISWVESEELPPHEYFHEGRATRRARLEYVLRYVNSDPIRHYVDANVRATLKLHELYNRVHKTKLGLTQQQLRVVVLNTKTSLEYFIRVWKW